MVIAVVVEVCPRGLFGEIGTWNTQVNRLSPSYYTALKGGQHGINVIRQTIPTRHTKTCLQRLSDSQNYDVQKFGLTPCATSTCNSISATDWSHHSTYSKVAVFLLVFCE